MAALTATDLIALWKSVVDQGYAQPFLDGQAAGVDTQFEVFEQSAVQLARASEMTERTTQSMYIRAWSGQTDDPASGAQQATLTATVTRTTRFEVPVSIVAGQVIIDEVATGWGDHEAQDVITGRRFLADETVTFGPGDAGPLTIRLVAERPGYGYNQPEPGSLNHFNQVGAGLSNDQATVVPGMASHRLIVRPDPDVVVPDHVGQYVELTAGLNARQVRRAIGYEGPNPTGSNAHGGVLVLAATGVFAVSGIVGLFQVGEEVVQQTGLVVTASGIFRRLTLSGLMVVDRTFGDFVVATAVTGVLSGATATLDTVHQSPDMVAEQHHVPPGASGAGWRVVLWGDDLGFVISNTASPTGGKSAMLDELGDERRIYRQPGELDTSYRKRISRVADKISPNAIRRIANSVFTNIGAQAYLREVGQAKFTGLFFDGDASSTDPTIAFPFDLDFGARPQDRFKLVVDYLEFRAFFLIGVPPVPLGDFGCAFDAGTCNAFDASPFLAFFDGSAVMSAIYYRETWAAVDDARAAGVGFDLYVEDIGLI
jgi:hypothetical protein